MLNTFPVKLTKVDGKWKKLPAVDKGTHWGDYKGEVTTPNWGVVIGKGYIVIDIDVKSGRSVAESQRLIEKEWEHVPDWGTAHIQDTPSGGAHFLFAVDYTVRQSQGDLYDTRCEGKGWICTGENYEVSFFGLESHFKNAPKLPLIRSLQEQVKEEIDDFTSHVHSDVTKDEIFETLERLPPDAVKNEEDWSKAGRIISWETNADLEAMERFIEWSRQSDKFKPGEIEKKWASWAQPNSAPMRYGTLVKMAGPQREKVALEETLAGISSVDFNSLQDALKGLSHLNMIQMMQVRSAVCDRFKQEGVRAPTRSQINALMRASHDNMSGKFVDNFVMMGNGEIIHRATMSKYNALGFNNLCAKLTPLTADGNPQSAMDFAMGNMHSVDELVYAPDIDQQLFTDLVGKSCMNIYNDDGVEPCDGEAWGSFKNHLLHLLPKKEADLLLYWLAHILQRKGKIIGWSPVLVGCQGDGKSYLSFVMGQVLGRSNHRELDPRQMETKFTGWAEGQLLSVVEDINIEGPNKHAVVNAFKPFITNETISTRAMYTEARTATNHTNYLFFSNHIDAIPMTNGDRRMAPIKTNWQNRDRLLAWEEKNPTYYQNLYQLARENAGSIRQGLMTMEIPAWFFDLKVAPDTNGLNDMIQASKSTGQSLVEHLIEEGGCREGIVDVTHLRALALESDEDFPTPSHLKKIMMGLGYSNMTRLRINGDRKRVYTKDKLSNEAIRAALE